jgi:Leucine-rich repeat (LRR) protein
MGGGNTKEKPKEKEKRDQARALKVIQNAIDSGASRLDLNNRHIRELPDSFEGKKDALKWLSISHNELTSLPKGVCQFVNLSALRLNGNQLSSLPDAIAALSALQVLDLSKNKFTEWDPRLTSMPQLTDLNLQCNQIGSVRPNFTLDSWASTNSSSSNHPQSRA